ncbi:IclR family transcriptional regulator C-terminal domain-containing protein [Gordonia sp. CPCC 205515]|uniref:IclR family transcriptional regulator n=1 Tax=Gordonia sp. CPCC 205515 TaxID=3140791 RepID=UPI003AF40708
MAVGRGNKPDAVARSMQIIEAVADLGVGTTGQEIAHRLRIPPATTYRLLNSLVAEEYLIRTADLRGFALGARLRSMVDAATTPTVNAQAAEHIEDFRGGVRFGVHIVYFRPTSVRLLDADPDHPFYGERELMRCPHASSAGKILLASRSQWRDMLQPPLAALTAFTIVDLMTLAAQIDDVRRTDFASDEGELVAEQASIAVPVYDVLGDVRGAVMVTGVVSRIEALIELAPRCRTLAATLGSLLY